MVRSLGEGAIPFANFSSSSAVIRLTVMTSIRYPLSLRQVGDLLFERGKGFGAAFGKKGTATHRLVTDSGTPPRGRSAITGGIGIAPLGAISHRSDPMMDGAYRDPGLGSSRHPPVSTTGKQGWERRGPK